MNIYDIAEKCGVSIATVSRVLNGSDKVSAATRERVMAVIAQESYAPSELARHLGKGGGAMPVGRTVGLLYTDLLDPLTARCAEYWERALRDRGLDTLLCGLRGDVASALADLRDRGAEAAVLLGSPAKDGRLPDAALPIPLLVVGGRTALPGANCVAADEESAMTALADMLIRRHRSRILLLHGGMTDRCRHLIAGYRAGYAAAGAEVSEDCIVESGRDPDAVNTCVKNLLVKGITFDAVIASEDLLGVGALKALQRTGLNMPVISFGDSYLTRCCTPELTAVGCAHQALCDAALAVLDRRLKGEEAPPLTLIPTVLTERGSFRQ